MTDPDSTLAFRPRRGTAVFLGGTLLLAAVALAFLGWALRPEDVEAMDGIQRLLFTVVSIRWFAWTFAVIFGILSARIAAVVFRAQPTLVMDRLGLSIRGGAPVQWASIDDVRARAKPDVLEIDLGERTLKWSAFELGADPQRVAAEIVQRRRSLGDAG